MNIPLLFLGFVAGLVANGVWYYYWAYLGARKGKPLGKYGWGFLKYFEHYHWATILAILGFRLKLPFLVGVSIAWFADEGLAQQHKFALGSDHFRVSCVVEIIILLLWALAELLLSLLTSIFLA